MLNVLKSSANFHLTACTETVPHLSAAAPLGTAASLLVSNTRGIAAETTQVPLWLRQALEVKIIHTNISLRKPSQSGLLALP